MKLSERIQKHFDNYLDLYIDIDLDPDGDNEDGLIESVCKLEADSKMLKDLIEMLSNPEIKGFGYCYWNEKGEEFNGLTAREALEAAIKGWKDL